MSSWTTLLLYGLFTWMVTIIVFCSADCNIFPEFPANHGCNCSLSNQTGLLLTDCEKDLKLNLPKLYRLTHYKSMISISNSAGVILCNDEDDLVLNDIREVSLILSNVLQVNICKKTFDQIVINAIFNNIRNLSFVERSFSSCWGTVWILNSSVTAIASAFSSSDIVVYKDMDSAFTIHARPKVTPRQKFKLVYQLATKVDDLEITIYALLALLGAIVLTLIALTIIVARKTTQLPLRSTCVHLPDVVPAPQPLGKKIKNPVTKVTKISRASISNRIARGKIQPNVSKYQQQTKNQRPPIPPPIHYFESC